MADDRAAFDLYEIDAAFGEGLEGMVERARPVQQKGDEGNLVGPARDGRRGGEEDKARVVMPMVFEMGAREGSPAWTTSRALPPVSSATWRLIAGCFSKN